jgi:quercetin dioxygenase-like cupin family protein
MSDSHPTNQIMQGAPMEHSLQGWDITRADQADWVPWGGPTGKARAKVLAIADDYYLALIEAEPGYSGDPHEHQYPEFLFVLDGSLRTQGVEMVNGDAYAAAAGSVHTDFTTRDGATYVLIFKL